MPETTSDAISSSQRAELRRICERLAYISGGSLPPDLDSLPSLITAMTFLTEICGKRLSRMREHESAQAPLHAASAPAKAFGAPVVTGPWACGPWGACAPNRKR